MSETPDLAQALLRSITRDEDGNLPDEQSPDPEWLDRAVEAGVRVWLINAGWDVDDLSVSEAEDALHLCSDMRAFILAALPAITDGIADAIEADGFAGCAHNGNEIRWASGVARNFGSEVAR